MDTISIATDEGAVIICEDTLSSITAADLERLRMSSSELHRIFAQAVELMPMQGGVKSDRHWVRPCASKSVDGRWDVMLLRYSDLSRP
jgi:hypothetical protein